MKAGQEMSRLEPTRRQHPLFNSVMLPLTGLLALLVTPATGLAANYTVTTASDTLANHTVGSSVCGTPCSLRAAVLSSNVNNGADSIFLGDFDPSLLLNGANENSLGGLRHTSGGKKSVIFKNR